MQNLINDLLTFSRVTHSKAHPFAQVDLGNIAREVMDDLESRIEMTKYYIAELGDLPVIDAEPLQMRQLLQNLIGNALKFRRLDARAQKFRQNCAGRFARRSPAPAQKLCERTVR